MDRVEFRVSRFENHPRHKLCCRGQSLSKSVGHVPARVPSAWFDYEVGTQKKSLGVVSAVVSEF